MHLRSDFRDFQEEMYAFGLDNEAVDTDSAALWGGMGTGKTVVSLTVAQELMHSCEVNKVLVVTPKTAAQHTWAGEHLEWDHLQDLDLRLITPTHDEDTKGIFAKNKICTDRMKGGDIHVVNPERLDRVVKLWGREWPYDMVVIDDTKGLKKPRSKTFMRFRQVSHKVNRFMVTNGTPMPNGYIQLWPQIFLLDQGHRLKRTFTDFKQTWFYPHPNGFKWLPRDDHEIPSRLTDIAVSIDGKDYMDTPTAERYIIDVPLPAALRKQYEELENDFYLELDSGEEIIARSKGIAYNKMKQFCNGAVYTDPLVPTTWSTIHDHKLDRLEELLEELSGENVIVAYQYDTDLQRIKKRFGKRAHDFKTTKNVKNRWNKGELNMLCMHPGSAGHGLNLQWGGRTIIWFGAEWSLELNDQMDERLGEMRQAQSGLYLTPRYYYLCVQNSVETLVVEARKEKGLLQDELRSRVKISLKNK